MALSGGCRAPPWRGRGGMFLAEFFLSGGGHVRRSGRRRRPRTAGTSRADPESGDPLSPVSCIYRTDFQTRDRQPRGLHLRRCLDNPAVNLGTLQMPTRGDGYDMRSASSHAQIQSNPESLSL